MPVLAFQIQADYDKVIRLREEIHKLKEEMKGVDAVNNPHQLNVLNQKCQQCTIELRNITDAAAQAGTKIETGFKKKIFDAQQVVNGFTDEIIKQKNIIADTSDKMKVLTDKYKDLKRNGQNLAANSMIPDINKAKKALDEEKYSLFSLTQERAKAQLSLKKYREEYQLFAKESGESSSILAKMKKEIMGLGAGMLAGFGLKELGSEIIRVRGQFQQADTAIQTLLGSKEKADALLSKVRDYAKISPLEFGDITKVTQMMLGFNIEAEKVPGFIKAIGDVSMGESSRFNSLALAFSQMSATGKLMGQDLLQMINAGFNPLTIMAEKTGKSVAQLKEEMSKGAISAEMVQQAFIDATSAGGKFYNMSENAAKTINGQLSMMHDALDSAMNEVGEASEGVIVGAISGVTKLIENYETVGRVLMGLVTTYGTYRTALAVVTFAENGHTLAMTLARAQILLTQKAQALLNATMLANPYVLAATAIAGLVSAMVLYKKSADDAELANEKLNKSFGATQAEITSEQKKIDELFDKLRKAEVGTNEYKEVKDTILKQYGSYLSGLNNEIATLKDVEGAYKAVAAAARDAALARGREAAIASANNDYNQKYSENIGKIYDQLKKKGFSEDDTKTMIGWIQDDLKKTGKVAEDTQRALHKYGVEFSWFGELNNAEKNLSYETQKINTMFGEQGKAVQDTSKKVTKLSDAYKSAEKNFRNAKNWLKQIENNKSDYTTEEYKNALQDYEAKKKAFKDAGGDPDKKKSGSGRTGTKEDIAERMRTLNDKQMTEQIRAAKDLEFSTREAEIKAMEEGTSKVIAQINLDRDKQYEAIERAYADLKQKRIDEAKKLWDADTSNKGKNFYESDKFKYASSDDRYTDEERANKAAKLNAADAEFNRSINDVKKEELQVLYDYLKEFGSIEEKKLAITKEYEQKIAEEQNPTKRAALMMGRDKELENLSQDQLAKQIDWSGIFSDLQGHTKEYLEGLKEQLQGLISSGDLSLEDMETAQEKIRDINALIAEQGNFFSFISPLQIEYNRRLQEEADAKALLEKAKGDESAASAAVSMSKAAIQDFLSSSGKGGNADISKDMSNPFKDGTKEYKQFNELITKLTYNETQLAKAREKTAKATQNAKNKEDANKKPLKDSWEKTKDNIENSKAYQNVQEVPGLLGGLGLGKESEKAQKGLNGLNDAMGAATDFFTGNYVGALTKGISAVTNFGEALGVWSNSNRAEIEAENNKLANAMGVNTDAINRLTEAMEKQNPEEAYKSYKQALELTKANEEAARNTMLNNARMYDGGHSLQYDFNDEYANIQLLRRIGSYLGVRITTLQELLSQSAATLNKLYDDEKGVKLLQELGQRLYDTQDSGNYNGMMNDLLKYMSDYSKDAYDELANHFQESVTHIGFDSMYDNFVSSLMDMNKEAEDFANDFEGYLRNAIYQATLSKKGGVKDMLSKWYENFAKAMESQEASGSYLSKSEIKDLMDEYQKIKDEADKVRDSIEELGLYDGTGEGKKDQSATYASVEKATYDQFDRFIGIATAQQISLEQIRNSVSGMTGDGLGIMSISLDKLYSLSLDRMYIVDDVRDIMARSFIELQEANEHLGKLEKSVNRIETSVSNTEQLINSRL